MKGCLSCFGVIDDFVVTFCSPGKCDKKFTHHFVVPFSLLIDNKNVRTSQNVEVADACGSLIFKYFLLS